MRYIRNVISFLVLLLGTAISLAAAVQVARHKFPEPATTERLDFSDWVMERDLTQESTATRSMLAQRMDVELRGGKWRDQIRDRQLSSEQRDRMKQNILLVLEQYFLLKMDRYFARPEGRREEFVDRELDHLWKLFEKQLPPQFRATDVPMAGAILASAAVYGQIGQWIERADPQLQPRMREFQTVVVARLQHRLTNPEEKP